MPIRLANIRLSVDEPEQALAERLAGALDVQPEAIARWRILRKSLDLRDKGRVQFVYTAEVVVPDGEKRVVARAAAGAGPRPSNCTRNLPSSCLSRGKNRFRCVPSSSAPAPPAWRPPIFWRNRAIGLWSGTRQDGPRAHSRHAGLRRRRPAQPGKQLPLRRRGGRHVQRRQTDLSQLRARRAPRAGTVRRVQGQAVDSLRLSSAPGEQPACRPSSRRCGERIEALGGEIRFECRVEDLDIADGRLRGLLTSSGYMPRRSSCWRSATAPATPTRCCSAAACRWCPSLFRSACASSSRRSRSTASNMAAGPSRTSSAPPTTAWWRAGRPICSRFCMCAGGQVIPSVSEPGLFLHQRHEPLRRATRRSPTAG